MITNDSHAGFGSGRRKIGPAKKKVVKRRCVCGHLEQNHSGCGEKQCCVLYGESDGEGYGCSCPKFTPASTEQESKP